MRPNPPTMKKLTHRRHKDSQIPLIMRWVSVGLFSLPSVVKNGRNGGNSRLFALVKHFGVYLRR